MKNLILFTLLSITSSMQSYAQKNNSEKIPETVLNAFNQKFPNAKKVEWEMENDKEWEAEFKMNGKEYSANFSVIGEWLETEYEIKESQIPKEVRSILDQNFKDYEIEEAEITETAAGSSYEFEIEVDEEEFEVVINAQGELTKKAQSEDED